MIVLNLICTADHAFEGWFASNDDFQRQSDEETLRCPVCGAGGITRRPSAPHVQRAGNSAPAAKPGPRRLQPALLELLQAMAAASEDVGERFPEEARRIHHGEAEERRIRGLASREETLELLEEGIAVLPVPLPAKGDLH